MIGGVPRETADGEKRVAIVPESVPKIGQLTIEVERDAGAKAGFSDAAFAEAGARVVDDAKRLYDDADLILKIQVPSVDEAARFKEGGALVSYLYPLNNLPAMKKLSERGVTAFALDLMPRISRAQAMDTLSSQATLAGYRAVTMAAEMLPKIFPLMMMAAGTIPPARVFVLGAGVSGLQAIATAHRLGAVVEAYDVRPTVKEQIESLGAKFVELPIQAQETQTSGGYAKSQSEDFYRKQQELLGERMKVADVVISTALVPGKKAPLLISEEAVKGMRPGSVIIDLAAEQGGNCAITEPGKTVVKYGVVIRGPLNVPSDMAPQASQLFSRNMAAYVGAIVKDQKLNLDTQDQLVKDPMVLLKGEVVYKPLKDALERSN
ncbi:MAG: Re/Si-specific NAD(P)(+) transhydrogenase subunit alpha [Thaumarchaeota archaeon]|nr:Re/Si-specific NAD(P)(+) transhydrogenase subunit alpha [Nitrososphaerota archaeon]